MKLATTLVLSCKDHFLGFNLPAKIGLNEMDRLCAASRICYSSLESNKNRSSAYQDQLYNCMKHLGEAILAMNPELSVKYNFQWDQILGMVRQCAQRHFPKDVRYMMRAMEYAKGLFSG
ncbi:uncharacterized protein [Dermacentor albipictus]|uniref:uncharacterized protein n=1 Tax=Dermacentor albipictus TaxID=60249 RepID=UPI0038FCEAB6